MHAYPRPQLKRADWISLDGLWDFMLDPGAACTTPREAIWDRKIMVPFSPETAASGVGDTGFYRACWYRKSFEPPPLNKQDRLLLHFGAIDHSATVWVNGQLAGAHH